MAESIVEIVLRVKDDAGRVISKVVKDVKDLGKAVNEASGDNLSKLAKGFSDVGDKSKEGADGASKMGATIRGLSGPIGSLLSDLRAVAPALAGAFAVSKLKSLADVGAQIQVTGTVLRIVAKNAGISATEITKLDKEVQALGITAVDSGKSITQFIQSGLAGVANENLGKIKELARAAQDLAVVSGQNSSETFSRLITNIQQMDTMGLRFMGIMVNRERAEEKYALALGKTSGELSEVEKKQAFMNATLVEAAKLQGAYEAAMGDAGKQLTSLPRLHSELAGVVSETLQPAYSALILTYSSFLKEAQKIAKSWRDSTDGGVAFGNTVEKIAKALKTVALFLVEHADLILKIVTAWAALKAVGIIVGVFSAVATSVVALNAAFYALYARIVAFGALTAMLGFFRALYVTIATAVPVVFSMGVAFTTASASGGAFVGVLAAIRVGALALLRVLGPIGLVIGAVALAWNALSGEGKKTPKILNADDERKAAAEIKTLVQETVEARNKAAEARAKANQWGISAEERALYEKEAKQLELEAQDKQRLLDKTALEKGLSKEKMKAIDQEEEGIRRINVAMKALEAEYDKVKQARQTLGITDKDGQTEVQKAQKSAAALQMILESTTQTLYGTQETFQQRLARVLESNAETIDSIALKAKNAGQSVEEWLENAYPTPEGVKSWEDLSTAIAAGGDRAVVAFKELSVGFDNFVRNAKSADEIAVALDTVGQAAGIMLQRVLAAKETLQFRAEQAAINDLNEKLVGFNERLKQLRGTMEIVGMLSRDNAQAEENWNRTMIQLGASFSNFQTGAVSLYSALDSLKSTTTEMGRLDADATRRGLAEAQDRYTQEANLQQAMYQRKRALIDEDFGNAKNKNVQLTALERESLNQRTENTKQFYQTLTQLRDGALQKFKEYADKVKALDKEIADLAIQQEQTIRDIKRKGMSEEEVLLDKKKEMDEQYKAGMEALEQRQYDKARDHFKKQIELAKELAGTSVLSNTQAVQEAESGYAKLEEAAKAEREEAKKAAEEQLNTYRELKTTIENLATQLGEMAKQQTVSLLATIDQTSLTEAMKSVEEAFSKLDIRIKVTPDVQSSSVAGYATGGLIDGPGTETSDSILAALSRNEFVTRAKAVWHYGADFYHALNSMSLPKSAIRAALGGFSLPHFNMGGLVGAMPSPAPAMRESMELNLHFNGRPLGRVIGSREAVHNLVDALNTVSRGA